MTARECFDEQQVRALPRDLLSSRGRVDLRGLSDQMTAPRGDQILAENQSSIMNARIVGRIITFNLRLEMGSYPNCNRS
jgi:hypothetical protein